MVGRRVREQQVTEVIGSYNGGHACATLAQDSVDRLGGGVGPALLEAVWRAEPPLFLRFGEFLHRRGAVAGESAAVFLAGHRTPLIPKSIHHRFAGRGPEWQTRDRRHRIHVRLQGSSVPPPPELVSPGRAPSFAVGCLAVGLRPAWM